MQETKHLHGSHMDRFWFCSSALLQSSSSVSGEKWIFTSKPPFLCSFQLLLGPDHSGRLWWAGFDQNTWFWFSFHTRTRFSGYSALPYLGLYEVKTWWLPANIWFCVEPSKSIQPLHQPETVWVLCKFKPRCSGSGLSCSSENNQHHGDQWTQQVNTDPLTHRQANGTAVMKHQRLFKNTYLTQFQMFVWATLA